MRLLDLFCGAGGAAMGYYRAGFTEIVGVDIEPQKRYPFHFVQADAFEYLTSSIVSGEIEKYDLIHASPKCQKWSITRSIHGNDHPDQIVPIRGLLRRSGRPYIIENVPGAPLINPIVLCGTMFGLRVIRHRLFEFSFRFPYLLPECDHWGKTLGNNAKVKNRQIVQSFSLAEFITVAGHDYKVSDGKIAMGIDWMVARELSQAIPPAYTEYIGNQVKLSL